ncbi:MAG: hypothetical protein CMF96_02215 [Candidatus Marinimicrobia bacterium]|nr:hypothetical protein [Candidatus Neomarinimicrobiota bacterium]
MTKIKLIFSNFLIYFTVLNAQIDLSINNGSINAGDTFSLEVSIANPDNIIGGFQFILNDFPDQLDLINVESTIRTDHMMIDFETSTNVIIAFDMTGQGLEQGLGPVLTATFNSNSIYTNSINMSFSDFFISDLMGTPLNVNATEGLVEVSGENPPPIFPPSDLVATGGYQNVSLIWTHPNQAEISGYRIYQNGIFIGESDLPSYTVNELETLVEYCFTVSAFDSFVESEQSASVCATTVDQYFEVAQNLTATVDGLVSTLDWDTPEGFLAIGQPCEEGCTDYNNQCIFDCNLQCVSQSTVNSWTGDGLCDDGTWNIFLNCDEFSCDGGDCLDPYTGDCVDDVYYNLNNPIPDNGKAAYEIEIVNNSQRIELLNYEVYRDNQLLGLTDETNYIDDAGLEFLETYCYNVIAVYDEGSSGYSNTACIETELSTPQNLIVIPGPGELNLSWQSHPDNAQNEFNIYKDGEYLATTVGLEFIDSDVIHNTDYCYHVSAVYDLGESEPSNTACSQWDLMTPIGLQSQAGDASVQLEWDLPGSYMTLSIEIMTDSYPTETSWQVINELDEIVASVDAATEMTADFTLYSWEVELIPGNYTFTIFDTFGDGICCIEGEGYYNLSLAGTVFYTGGEFQAEESIEFGPNGNIVAISNSVYNIPVIGDRGGIPENIEELELITTIREINNNPVTELNLFRNLLGFNIYRDNQFITNVDEDITEYEDIGLTNNIEYCYAVTAVYEEGESEESNNSCSTPITGIAPANLFVLGSNGGLDLEWEGGSDLVIEYRIYRDNEYLTSTNEINYFDQATQVYQEYCYYITSLYSSGESMPTNVMCARWELDPPMAVIANAGDASVTLNWDEPTALPACADFIIPSLPYDHEGSTIGQSDDWLVQGWGLESQGADQSYLLRVNNPTSINVSLCGDVTNYDTKLEIFTADMECVETTTGYYNDDAWENCTNNQSALYNVALEYGDYYIVVDGYSAQEGNYELHVTEVGGTVQNSNFGDGFNKRLIKSFKENQAYELEKINIERHEDSWVAALNNTSPLNRALTGYRIHREEQEVGNTEPAILTFTDEGLQNNAEYCYRVYAEYDEGDSEPSNEACATPITGIAPTDLYVVGEGGQIHLTWQSGGLGLVEYNIYRNGDYLASSSESEYFDTSAENDVEYCYIVTGVYSSGESMPTNESCGMWVLAAPLGLTTTPGNGFIELNWNEPGTNLCADAVIPQLPYSDISSNVGMGDDWLVQGSQGSDYSYMLTLGSPTVIDVTLCGMTTDYDTKLEIFTANDECVETTTGQYIDDDYTNCPDYIAPYPPSGLWGVSLNPGVYYIVVDGFGGSEGTFEINVTQSGLAQGVNPNPISESIRYEESKSGLEINDFDWVTADGSNYSGEPIQIEERNLINFQMFRDGNQIVELDPSIYNYIDNGLENGTEYCYHIVANYDQGASQPTPEVCDSPDAGPMCPPENLMINSEVGQDYVGLSWDAPDGSCQGAYVVSGNGGSQGIATDCVTDESYSGMTDCIGFCFRNENLDWIGDGWCDDGRYGIDLLCEEWGWDGSDCEGDGIGFSEKNVIDNSGFEPVDMRDRLEGYNIYKDNQFLSYTLETNYFDSEIDFNQEYCYKVKAVYSEGESNPTSIECGTVPDPAGYSVLEGPSFDMNAGSQAEFSINLENQEVVAGFQFTLNPDPSLISFGEVSLTPRSEGFLLEANLQENGSLIIVGFDINGEPLPVGQGPILNISCTSDYVLSPQDINIIFSEVYIGNAEGEAIPLFANTGTITVVPEGAIELSLSGGELNTGEEIAVNLSLTNDVAVGSFQIYITDTPDVVSFIEISSTDRTTGFVIDANEVDNDLIIVGFGDVIQPGSGPIMTLTLQGVSSGMSELEIFDVVFSDIDENLIPVMTYSSQITVSTIVSVNIELSPMMQNLVSFGVIPEDNNIESILSDTDVLVVSNDNSQWFVPSFSVNQISDLGSIEGYRAIVAGNEQQVIPISGQPIDLNEIILLEPGKINLMPYFSFLPMTVPEVFNGLENNILLVKNDQGEYYIPSIGEMSLTQMNFGEAYQVYLSGDEAIEFTYPTGSLASYIDLGEYKSKAEARKTEYYPQLNTGISHPIYIDQLRGSFNLGDEIGAYANGRFVGGVKITNNNSAMLIAAGGFDSYGVEIEGYNLGDKIDLRLWSKDLNRELRIESNFDSPYYGINPISRGSVEVYKMDAIPEQYFLSQNYPNPFNPTTSIEFAIPEDTYINLAIYDIMGRLVKTLVDSKIGAGYHKVVWDGTDSDSMKVAASLYIYVLKNNKVTITKKMVIMK